MNFVCPVCSEDLISNGKSLICKNNHLFDISKKGYVNLLLGRDGSLHGDSKQMINARADFLDKGFYEPLKNEIISCLKELSPLEVIADCGCGECYYTSAVQAEFKNADVLAIDISKDALSLAKRRSEKIKKAVASVFKMPIKTASCDAVLNIFSPFVKEEYLRILKPEGYLIMVIPLREHLWEMKKIVYDKPYYNEPKDTFIEGAKLIKSKEVTFKKEVERDELVSLFKMTPYFIKTSPQDAKKLENAPKTLLTFSFKILVYTKSKE